MCNISHSLRLFFARLIHLLLLWVLFTEQATADYSWKMAFIKYTEGAWQSLPFSRPLTLTDGDQFQLVLSADNAGFLDVLYEDTTGAITILYQGSLKAGQVIILPAEDEHFKVSPPSGTEKIHVIVSSNLQTILRMKLKDLPNGSSSILDEIARIKRTLLSLAKTPEKPMPFTGVRRILPYDVVGTMFGGAADAYLKTIRFDH